MDKNMKILIVDDFSTMRRIIKNLLRDLGFNNTVEADDGSTALPVLKNGGIDFLVTDWNMPGMSGLELQDHVNRLGNALRAMGVRMEERVAVLLPDSPEWVFAFFGAMKIGAVAIPLNTNLKPSPWTSCSNGSMPVNSTT